MVGDGVLLGVGVLVGLGVGGRVIVARVVGVLVRFCPTIAVAVGAN